MRIAVSCHVTKEANVRQVGQVRAGWHGVHCKGLSERDVLDVYLRQSGLLGWAYDATGDVQETEREDPLHKQWGEDSQFW